MTRRSDSGETVWMEKGGLCLEPCEIRSYSDVRKILVRLADYEDTGMTPEGVAAIMEEKEIWRNAYCDLAQITKQSILQMFEALSKVSGEIKHESEG